MLFSISAVFSKNLVQISKRLLQAAFVFFTTLSSIESIGQGNLLITPKRIVFDGTRRSEELNLVNIGKDTSTYVVSFVQNRMTENGTFEAIVQPDSGQYFADKYLRFFPRTVTLAPNEAQSVKVQVTKSNELVQGEYRSHLYFRSVPKETPLGEKEAAKDSGISVRIVPVFGISVPMIIRMGQNTTSVTLTEMALQFQDTLPILNVTFNRQGNMSVYGDIMVEHISVSGKITKAGIVKGMAIYSPNRLRRFAITLDKTANIDYNEGKLRVKYIDQSPKANKIAESEMVLNGKTDSTLARNKP